MKPLIFAFIFLTVNAPCQAQQDPEFPKGWVMYLEARQGMATQFNSSSDLYLGSLGITPQYTIIPHSLRIGATGGGVYYNKKLDGLIGPRLALKLSTINVKNFGSLLNLQLELEQLWGTSRQQLLGLGLSAELGQILSVGVSSHRDYRLNQWWFQAGLGFNFLHKKKGPPIDPLSN